jgi:lipopolysaccharide transport system permease protein
VLIYLNPAAPIVLSWRQLFLTGDLHWPTIAVGYLYAIVVFALGTAVYAKLSWKFAEVV